MKGALALLLVLWTANAFAHKASTSYLQLRVNGTEVRGRWDIALRDLDYVLALDTDGDTQLTWGEVRGSSRRSRITRCAASRCARSGRLHALAREPADRRSQRWSLRKPCARRRVPA
jgi:hypothetical protein